MTRHERRCRRRPRRHAVQRRRRRRRGRQGSRWHHQRLRGRRPRRGGDAGPVRQPRRGRRARRRRARRRSRPTSPCSTRSPGAATRWPGPAEMVRDGSARHVVLYTWDAAPPFVRAAEEIGVSGVVLKTRSADLLVDSIERIVAGERVGFDVDPSSAARRPRGRPVRPRVGGPGPDRQGPDERPDRRRAVPVDRDGEDVRQAAVRQARRPQPGAGRRGRVDRTSSRRATPAESARRDAARLHACPRIRPTHRPPDRTRPARSASACRRRRGSCRRPGSSPPRSAPRAASASTTSRTCASASTSWCPLLVEAGGGRPRRARVRASTTSSITVRGSARRRGDGPVEVDELTARIVEAVADHHEIDGSSFSLTKASSIRGVTTAEPARTEIARDQRDDEDALFREFRAHAAAGACATTSSSGTWASPPTSPGASVGAARATTTSARSRSSPSSRPSTASSPTATWRSRRSPGARSRARSSATSATTRGRCACPRSAKETHLRLRRATDELTQQPRPLADGAAAGRAPRDRAPTRSSRGSPPARPTRRRASTRRSAPTATARARSAPRTRASATSSTHARRGPAGDAAASGSRRSSACGSTRSSARARSPSASASRRCTCRACCAAASSRCAGAPSRSRTTRLRVALGPGPAAATWPSRTRPGSTTPRTPPDRRGLALRAARRRARRPPGAGEPETAGDDDEHDREEHERLLRPLRRRAQGGDRDRREGDRLLGDVLDELGGDVRQFAGCVTGGGGEVAWPARRPGRPRWTRRHRHAPRRR